MPGLCTRHGRIGTRDGAGEVRQQVERLHGAIRTAADVDAEAEQRFPGVTCFGKLRSNARLGNVLIRLHKMGCT